ncbi:MAG: deoxyribose-phosphate aldolase [Acidimicrobiales bacterium]
MGDTPPPRDDLPTVEHLAAAIDHALLRPELTSAELTDGLRIALSWHTASACVRGSDVARAAEELAGSGVIVGTVIGFPHGSTATAAKVAEVAGALEAGAEEFDMVIHIGALRGGEAAYVERDIRAVVEAAAGRTVKVILENAYLDDDQKVLGCHLAEEAGAGFVKTNTGFAPGGATAADVSLMRASVSPHVGVKAAGGLRTLDAVLAMEKAGANRFGVSATAAILTELRRRRGSAGDPGR